jgi:hypothetical protein
MQPRRMPSCGLNLAAPRYRFHLVPPPAAPEAPPRLQTSIQNMGSQRELGQKDADGGMHVSAAPLDLADKPVLQIAEQRSPVRAETGPTPARRSRVYADRNEHVQLIVLQRTPSRQTQGKQKSDQPRQTSVEVTAGGAAAASEMAGALAMEYVDVPM